MAPLSRTDVTQRNFECGYGLGKVVQEYYGKDTIKHDVWGCMCPCIFSCEYNLSSKGEGIRRHYFGRRNTD
jgi:hypothetical protein